MYKLTDKDNNKEYYINSNKTILYLYDKNLKVINRTFRDKWSSMSLEVDDKQIKKEVDLKEIIENDNDFIKSCQIISSTMKPRGYFEEKDDFGIKYHYLNEFLGSETFLNSKNKNKYNDENIIDLLEKETPLIFKLLKNLFYNENNNIIINFINWLNVVGFKDKNQDIIFNFFGTNEQDEGGGRGKGVLIKLLNKIFSGLVVSVSNTTYLNNFNSNLMNKKIVLFEEVNYKGLRYEIIKDITGSPFFRVEYKGKEPIYSDNVSSWLMFSNECDLCNKIGIEDRRVFLIRPNPKNGSLKREVIDKFFDGDYDNFEEKLFEEIDNFIYIIRKRTGRVLSPLELQTQRYKDYFKEKTQVSILEIDDIYKILINTQFREKIIEIMEIIGHLDNNYKKQIETIKKVINLNMINFKTFSLIFKFLKDNGYISKTKTLNKEWEIMKENLLKNGFDKINVELKKTKIFDRFKDTIIIKNDYYLSEKHKINSVLRDLFGEKMVFSECFGCVF